MLLLPGGMCVLSVPGCLHLGREAMLGNCSVTAGHVALGHMAGMIVHESIGATCIECVVLACLQKVPLPVPMKSCMRHSLVQGDNEWHWVLIRMRQVSTNEATVPPWLQPQAYSAACRGHMRC